MILQQTKALCSHLLRTRPGNLLPLVPNKTFLTSVFSSRLCPSMLSDHKPFLTCNKSAVILFLYHQHRTVITYFHKTIPLCRHEAPGIKCNISVNDLRTMSTRTITGHLGDHFLLICADLNVFWPI